MSEGTVHVGNTWWRELALDECVAELLLGIAADTQPVAEVRLDRSGLLVHLVKRRAQIVGIDTEDRLEQTAVTVGGGEMSGSAAWRTAQDRPPAGG